MSDKLMLFERKDRVVISSRVIAKRFEKEHFHLLRDVKSLVGGISKNGDTPSKYH